MKIEKKKASNTSGLMQREEYMIISRLLEMDKVKKTARDYRLLKEYDAMKVEGKAEKLVKKGTCFRCICAEELFQTLPSIHIANE